MISERLKSALEKEVEAEKLETKKTESEDIIPVKKVILTTEEELEGYYIIKGILRKKLQGSRIFQRDTQTYFGVLLDDNNRKPLCRLWLNGGKKYLSLFDKDKNEVKYEIKNLDEIYNFSEQLLETVEVYEKEY